MEITFPSKESNVAFACDVVKAFVLQMDPTIDEIGDINTAVTRAVQNVVIHAYPNKMGKVLIKATIFDNILEIKVRDWGLGIDDVESARKPLYTTCEGLTGMGFTMMESYAESISVMSVRNKGTTVTMKWKIPLRVEKK